MNDDPHLKLIQMDKENPYPMKDCLSVSEPLIIMLFLNTLKSKIEEMVKDLIGQAHSRSTLLGDMLWKFTGSCLYQLVENEILFDLYRRYMQQDLDFAGEKEIEKTVRATYKRYEPVIANRVNEFEKNISILKKRHKLDREQQIRIKQVEKPREATLITLDIRFAVIKRANGKCEACENLISEKPIDVYLVRHPLIEDDMDFLALCENCVDDLGERVVSENG